MSVHTYTQRVVALMPREYASSATLPPFATRGAPVGTAGGTTNGMLSITRAKIMPAMVATMASVRKRNTDKRRVRLLLRAVKVAGEHATGAGYGGNEHGSR